MDVTSNILLPVYAGETGREGRKYRTIQEGDVLPGFGCVKEVIQGIRPMENAYVSPGYAETPDFAVTITTHYGNVLHVHAYDLLYVAASPAEMEAYYAHMDAVREASYTTLGEVLNGLADAVMDGMNSTENAGEPERKFNPRDITVDSLSYNTMVETARLYNAGSKLDAIKYVREVSGWRLREAMEYVNAVSKSGFKDCN